MLERLVRELGCRWMGRLDREGRAVAKAATEESSGVLLGGLATEFLQDLLEVRGWIDLLTPLYTQTSKGQESTNQSTQIGMPRVTGCDRDSRPGMQQVPRRAGVRDGMKSLELSPPHLFPCFSLPWWFQCRFSGEQIALLYCAPEFVC